jgi:type I restriction enzyme S subunit
MKTTLRDYCDLISIQVDPRIHAGATYVGLEHIMSGELVRSGGGRGDSVQSSKFAFEKNDVLYGKLRPYLDKAILADCDGICTTELLVLRPKSDVDPRFLSCVVHTRDFIDHAMSGVTGVQHPRTSWHRISEFEVLPFTPDEQMGIAAIVWKIHEALQTNQRALTTYQDLKDSAMRELFSQGLRGESRKESEIGSIPESWDVVGLGSLGRIGNGSTPKRDVKAYWEGGYYPWLTSAKVYDRLITAADEFVTDEALARCHLPRVKAGSLVMAITGQGKTLGNCALLGIEATVSQHLAYVSINSSEVAGSYIRGYLETRYGYLRDVASGGGSTKGALTCAFLRDLPIPLPPTRIEQQEIADVLDAIDQKIDLHKQKKAVLEDLFRALLHKLVTGEVRVSDLDLSALETASAVEVTV